MSHRPLAYSLVRLMSAARSPTPRGIDRIDIGILMHLFETWPGDCFGVAPTLLGPRLFSRERVLRGCHGLMALWRENTDADNDPVLASLDARLAGQSPATPDAAPRRSGAMAGLGRALRLLFSERIELGGALGRVPQGSLYLDMGHDGLTFPTMTGWLEKRPDVAPVILIHDIIPLLHPAFEKPETVQRHTAAVARAQQLARLIVTPTQAVANELEAYFAASGGRSPRTMPCPLPVDSLFLRPQSAAPDWAARHYFVTCGTIEPRKNQLLLVAAWEQLVARLGAAAPLLIVAGARGAAASQLDRKLAENPALAGKVIVVSGLSSAALARLVAHARALLMPSIAEGFGLPPLEALALGTPALASDIPAHRDALGIHGQFLPPLEARSWAQAVEALACDNDALAAARARIAPHVPRSWAVYGAALSALLATVP